MSRGIDDIQTMPVPLATGGRRLDGNATFLLLIHEVGGCRAVVHFTDLVDLAGEFQNTLGRGGFTGIYMGKNADIPIFVQVSHQLFPVKNIKNLFRTEPRLCRSKIKRLVFAASKDAKAAVND